MTPFFQRLLLQAVGFSIAFTAVAQMLLFALQQPTATNILDRKIDELKLATPADFVGSTAMQSQYIRNAMRNVIRNAFKGVLMNSRYIDPFVDVLNQERYVLMYDIPFEDLNASRIDTKDLNARIVEKYSLYKQSQNDCIGVKLGVIRINNIEESDKILKTVRFSTPEVAGGLQWCRLHYSDGYQKFLDGDSDMYTQLSSQITQWTNNQGTLYTPELVKYKGNLYVLYPEKCYDLRATSESSWEHISGVCLREISVELAKLQAIELQQQLINNEDTSVTPKLYNVSIRDQNKYSIELLKSVFGAAKNEFCILVEKDKCILIKVVDIVNKQTYKRENVVNHIVDSILVEVAKE